MQTNNNEALPEKDYKVGDQIWFVPRGHAIAIKCKITGIDDYFRKKSPEAYLFYDIDEPCGHYLATDEFVESREAAEQWLLDNYDDYLDFIDENPNEFSYKQLKELEKDSLEKYRESTIKFIVETWWDHSPLQKAKAIYEWLLELEDNRKEKDKGWIFLYDLLEKPENQNRQENKNV